MDEGVIMRTAMAGIAAAFHCCLLGGSISLANALGDTEAQNGAVAIPGSVSGGPVYTAAMIPTPESYSTQRWEYLQEEAAALYRQGAEYGDNAALILAIDRYRHLLDLVPRTRVPLDWAMMQSNLGTALAMLGERES